jgi:hypothetical protein
MRTSTILDIVQAVTEAAPSHPEVAVWWYARAAEAGAPVQLVLEASDGTPPDTARIGLELAARLRVPAVVVRAHRGTGETAALYRVFTAGNRRAAAGHTGGP